MAALISKGRGGGDYGTKAIRFTLDGSS